MFVARSPRYPDTRSKWFREQSARRSTVRPEGLLLQFHMAGKHNQASHGHGGHKATSHVMTRAEADEWSKDSVVKEPVYHFTSAAGEKAILNEGLKPGTSQSYAASGGGTFFTVDPDFKQSDIGQMSGNSANAKRVESRLNLKANEIHTEDHRDYATLGMSVAKLHTDYISKYGKPAGVDPTLPGLYEGLGIKAVKSIFADGSPDWYRVMDMDAIAVVSDPTARMLAEWNIRYSEEFLPHVFHMKGKHNQKSHGGNAAHVPDVSDIVEVKGTGVQAKVVDYMDYKNKNTGEAEAWLKLETKVQNKLWHQDDNLKVVTKGAGIGGTPPALTPTPAVTTPTPAPAVPAGPEWTKVSTGYALEKGQAIQTPNGVGSFNKNMYDKDGYWVHVDVPGAKKKWYKVADVTAAVAEGKGVKYGDHTSAPKAAVPSSTGLSKSPDSIAGLTVKKYVHDPKVVTPDEIMISKKVGGVPTVEHLGPLHPKMMDVHNDLTKQGYSYVGTAASNAVYMHPTKPTLAVGNGVIGVHELGAPGKTVVDQSFNKITPGAPVVHAAASSTFPSGLGSTTHVQSLGGSTGATLVKGVDGTLYVQKKGASIEHIQSEYHANKVYKAAGVDVPDVELYGGHTQLAKHVKGTELGKLKGEEFEKAAAKLRQNYVLDAVLGNRDVVGLSKDNVLVDSSGKVWRIDNGSSFDFRAQGTKKEFGNTVTELTSMKDPKYPQTHAVYGKITPQEMHAQALHLQQNKAAILAQVPDKHKATVSARIDDAVAQTSKMISPTHSPTPSVVGSKPAGAPTGKVDKKNEPLHIGDTVVGNGGAEFKITHVSPEGYVHGTKTKMGTTDLGITKLGDDQVVFGNSVTKVSTTASTTSASAPTTSGANVGGWQTGHKFAGPGGSEYTVTKVNMATNKVTVKVGDTELDYTPAQLGSAGFKPPSTTSSTTVTGATTGGTQVRKDWKAVWDSLPHPSASSYTTGQEVQHATKGSGKIIGFSGTSAQVKWDSDGSVTYHSGQHLTSKSNAQAAGYGVSTSTPPAVSTSSAASKAFPKVGESFHVLGKGTGQVTEVQSEWVKIEGVGKKKWYTTAEVNDMLANAPKISSSPGGHSSKYDVTQVGDPPTSMSAYSKTVHNGPMWTPWVNGWKNSLTSGESTAVSSYKNSSYAINGALRTGKTVTGNLKTMQDNLDKALAKSVIPFHATVTRRVGYGVLEQYAAGDKFRDLGFFGTSTDSPFAEMPVKMTVHIPAGSHGAYLDAVNKYGSEHEILLPRGSHFQIIKKDGNNYEMVLIPD